MTPKTFLMTLLLSGCTKPPVMYADFVLVDGPRAGEEYSVSCTIDEIEPSRDTPPPNGSRHYNCENDEISISIQHDDEGRAFVMPRIVVPDRSWYGGYHCYLYMEPMPLVWEEAFLDDYHANRGENNHEFLGTLDGVVGWDFGEWPIE